MPPPIATRKPGRDIAAVEELVGSLHLQPPTDVNLVCVDAATGITLRTQFKMLSRQWEFWPPTSRER